MQKEYELTDEERMALTDLNAEINVLTIRHATELALLRGQGDGVLRLALKLRGLREGTWGFTPDGKKIVRLDKPPERAPQTPPDEGACGQVNGKAVLPNGAAQPEAAPSS